MMENQALFEVLSAAVQDKDILLQGIPNIDLYMDQILSLFEKGLGGEKPLTKTMINNYSKEKLIEPSKGKKYSRTQLVYLLMIYSAKNTLSIADIKELFAWMKTDPPLGEKEIEQCYEQFLCSKVRLREQLPEQVAAFLESGDETLTEKQRQLVSALSVAAVGTYCRRMAEGMIQALTEP